MIDSKLPNVGTTIFTLMSQLAAKHSAINLSQGFPDFDGPAFLKERVSHYINQGLNQYAPMTGLPALREQIANKTFSCYQRRLDAESEVTITSGATEALFAAIHAVVKRDDEVIIFDPAYDSYAPAIELAGGHPIHLALDDEFSIDFEQLDKAINNKTSLVIINSPHNPTGAILDKQTMEALEKRIIGNGLFLISDEVYEHIVFDDQQHWSVNCFSALAERSFVVSSFGKTFHTTGWKVGYCVAPKTLSVEFRKVHQYLTFCTVTPIQAALADMLEQHPEHWQELSAFYQTKRDHLRNELAKTRFKLMPCQGTYFQLVDYSNISDKSDTDFANWLTTEVGVASVPISVFYKSKKDQHLIRLCVAKNEETLSAAAEKLAKL
ncbi:pyridoxal phosphate-dependent aminotransferase [Pleionea sediminis]|uniref:pyridoxal phosphate-dependent aminotransferase n=1 Tax=Pleionea sediminis TaxID=2569479 RepID=UPI001186DF43|nr:pyridoxal phosphate-dependent aminotransferase [Pleionea sediminis]